MFNMALALAAQCLALLGCGSASRAPHIQREIGAVNEVVEALSMAILNKDKTVCMRLFFSGKPEDIGWQAVVDDAKLAKMQQDRGRRKITERVRRH